MLNSFYRAQSKAQPYYQDQYFNIWKFATDVAPGKRQRQPLILSYSIMTRAYGTFFVRDNFIDFFNKEGFDVYLMDWGKDGLFTLSGWSLDMLADALRDKAVEPLLEEYGVESLDVFGICIGGLITAYLINREMKTHKHFARKFHKIAFYGSPILGARDLGVMRSFIAFYETMKHFRPMLDKTGISLFTLNAVLSEGTSHAMIEWAWKKFWDDGPDTFFKIVNLTCDDRLVPFAAFMDILEQAFASGADRKEAFHFTGDVRNIHFFNLVGERDFLVMPSASIVEWKSDIPKQFASFEQLLFPGGHFTFARPCFNEVKLALAQWFGDDRPRVTIGDQAEVTGTTARPPLRIAGKARAAA